jgi:hypothetical protein
MNADKKQVGGVHYIDKAVQPWDAMASCMSQEEFAGFLRGNVIKYTMRCKDKGGMEDLKKAQHYLEKLLEVLENAQIN